MKWAIIWTAIFGSALTGYAYAEKPFAQLASHFTYDSKAPLDIRESKVEDRNGTKIYDISYASPKGGRVPAYLVVPAGKGPYAGIIFGHWAKDGSPVRNRKEFLDEAVALAAGGAVSLLIDAPFAIPGFHPDADPLSDQQPLIEQQQVIDLRRGVDLLLSRTDVDSGRIAYVGHSFDAAVGGILAGTEKRIIAYVLMTGTFDVAYFAHSNAPAMVAFRKQVGDKKVNAYLAKWNWLDPAHYVGHTAPAAIFLQYAETDGHVPMAQRSNDIALFHDPKVEIYEGTDHALNAKARLDRYQWLRAHIALRAIGPSLLDRLPSTR